MPVCAPLFASVLLLAGCSDPLSGPLDLFHDLEGGEIAAQRPPPPGAGMPYPKLGTVPAKPALPDAAFRNGLQAQLVTERDRTQRAAADTPVEALPPPPPAAPPLPPAGAQPSGTAAPGTPTSGAASPAFANATLDTADAPPAAGQPTPVVTNMPAPSAHQAGPPAASLPAPATTGPAPGAPLTIVGEPGSQAGDAPGVPVIPAAPPPPASFEGVAAEPAPTPRVLPAGLAAAPAGAQVFFATGTAILPPSQTQALREFLSHRRGRPIEIIGLGEALSDTPDGQAAAVTLAFARAQAVQAALQTLHVQPGAMRLGANAFGRGAVLRLLP